MRFATFNDYYKNHLTELGCDVKNVETKIGLTTDLPVFMIPYITSKNQLENHFVKKREFLNLHKQFRNEKLEIILGNV